MSIPISPLSRSTSVSSSTSSWDIVDSHDIADLKDFEENFEMDPKIEGRDHSESTVKALTDDEIVFPSNTDDKIVLQNIIPVTKSKPISIAMLSVPSPVSPPQTPDIKDSTDKPKEELIPISKISVPLTIPSEVTPRSIFIFTKPTPSAPPPPLQAAPICPMTREDQDLASLRLALSFQHDEDARYAERLATELKDAEYAKQLEKEGPDNGKAFGKGQKNFQWGTKADFPSLEEAKIKTKDKDHDKNSTFNGGKSATANNGDVYYKPPNSFNNDNGFLSNPYNSLYLAEPTPVKIRGKRNKGGKYNY